jgi:phosphonopyruvate decarboxylase
MRIEDFIDTIGVDFFTGVPDSQLKALCDYLLSKYGTDGKHHIIAANEGNCTAIAAGYYLVTGKYPMIYFQNSGEGNAINPIASLLNEKVYAIPAIFVVGWRGEPGINDEPQHIFQGEITLKILEILNIKTYIVSKETTKEDISYIMTVFQHELSLGNQVAFVIKKGALEYNTPNTYENDNRMIREEIIEHIVSVSQNNPIVSTTGKISRELFEIREKKKQNHSHDFLTVGSMGHCSSIALGIAMQKPEKRIWIIDGDGAVLMHMGALATIGSAQLNNIVHIVINNGSHESVGGQPTVMNKVDLCAIAKACGYNKVVSVDNYLDLDKELNLIISTNELTFIEIKCSISSRNDLGRPTHSAKENKDIFMSYLSR